MAGERKRARSAGGGDRRVDFFGHGEEIRAALIRRLPRRPVRALDVGTGIGRSAIFLGRYLPPGSRVWSIDSAEDSLRRGEEAIRRAEPAVPLRLLAGAAESLPFRDGAFDLATGVMLFHHLADLRPALSEMGRVVRADGRLLLLDWGPTAHLLPFAVEHRPEDFFTPRAVERILLEAGLHAEVEHHPNWYLIEAVKD